MTGLAVWFSPKTSLLEFVETIREHSRALGYDVCWGTGSITEAPPQLSNNRNLISNSLIATITKLILPNNQQKKIYIKSTITMSSQSYSTFSSTTYSSSSDSSGNRYEEHTSSNPSGTTIHRTTQESGKPAVSETTRIPTGGAAARQVEGFDSQGRIEDVSDKDKLYEENIEDEYAKKEGGAWMIMSRKWIRAFGLAWTVGTG